MATLLTKRGHITAKPFAKVPALGDLPEIQPARATVSGVSSRCGVEGDPGVDLAEGCIVTKTIKYTHQLVHWVNAVRSGDPKDVVSEVPTRSDLLSLFSRKTCFDLDWVSFPTQASPSIIRPISLFVSPTVYFPEQKNLNLYS